jgi:CAAX prenyl protease-like protein
VSRSSSVPYIAPFAVFVAFIALRSVVVVPDLADQIVRVAVTGAVLALVSRPVLDFRVKHAAATVAIGIGVFVLWIGPDVLWPAYRHSRLFSNFLAGTAQGSLSESARSNAAVLALRSVRAAMIVPIAEELFWRAWLMRWIIDPNFQKVPLGTYAPSAFWIVAVLFASEHGSYWDVGLAAGVVYNWWMVRTKSLGDLILAHAVTNACLCGYVIAGGKWEYWL